MVRAFDAWARRKPLHAGLFAAAALLALLLAFQQVVQDGVRQAELRRQARAEMADMTWRCKLLRDTEARHQCLARR